MPVSINFCFNNAKSSVNSEICQPRSVPTPAKTVNSTSILIMTESTLWIFLLSSHLHKGNKSVASTPATAIGIRKASAKCSPAITRNISRSFFIIEELEIFILNSCMVIKKPRNPGLINSIYDLDIRLCFFGFLDIFLHIKFIFIILSGIL